MFDMSFVHKDIIHDFRKCIQIDLYNYTVVYFKYDDFFSFYFNLVNVLFSDFFIFKTDESSEK